MRSKTVKWLDKHGPIGPAVTVQPMDSEPAEGKPTPGGPQMSSGKPGSDHPKPGSANPTPITTVITGGR